ncbi:hypothetical protein RSAG8_02356, partial [Rhizoctonia solani AG-8 WAC10335]
MLSCNRRPQRRRPPAERPTPHWFTLGSLRSFGTRLWNPPPPSREEHYIWLVKPKYTVLLEDVVADRHLPPLSRHDFEEYLYYVEGSLKNLFVPFSFECPHVVLTPSDPFDSHLALSVLPAGGTSLPSSSKGSYRPRELWERLKDCQDPRLRTEFALAKDTFFRPDASLRLNIPNEYLDRILLIPNIPPPHNEQELTNTMPTFPNQPEPSIFDPILSIVRDALNTSFASFIKLAFSNAGLWHCVPGACGGALIVAGGLVMWSMGMTSYRRGYVAGSLPIIWVGLWFMLVTLSGHCLTVYVTGDARQLYPWEVERHLPPDVIPPPVYSLTPAPAPDGVASTPTHSYKRYLRYSLPPARPSLPIRQHTRQYRTPAGRRWSEGVLNILGRRKDDDKPTDFRALDRETESGPLDRLPPARKTKDLARSSLVMDVEQAKALGKSRHTSVLTLSPKGSVTDLSERRNAVGLEPEGRPESPFSEENDFGIVLSEAYEEDEPGPFLFPAFAEDRPAPVHSFNNDNPVQPHFTSGCYPEPLAPLVQAPGYAAQRRRTVLDLFASEPSGSRRGSKASEVERVRKQSPWPRSFLGPMTLVHSPLVRRAHWVVTMRSAIVASVITCGLAIGLVH